MSKKLSHRLERALAEDDDIEAAEHTTDPDAPQPGHVKVTRPGRARSKVLQVRHNPEEMAALEAIAERRELPVSTVAREQLLRLLAEDEGDLSPLGHLLDAARAGQRHRPRSAATLRACSSCSDGRLMSMVADVT
ncbi:hypothetical protein [Mycobacterium shinjukuense]|uniref:Uncharacterized protein n=1 Tax=Mycobacterium shinjukuense TaxID=398694 RepID=A0A7I7ML87_9MYCO|nr:hypothetical protein [Mycobacterium shinjukuense]BBX72905.1 hypothetical protein MSHI_08110 [Mycobacterium shinjukuense]